MFLHSISRALPIYTVRNIELGIRLLFYSDVKYYFEQIVYAVEIKSNIIEARGSLIIIINITLKLTLHTIRPIFFNKHFLR